MAYNFTAEWIKGNKNDAPDVLSYNPLLDPEKDDTFAKINTKVIQKWYSLKLEPCMVALLKVSDYKTFDNMLKKISNISSYAISSYMDSLSTGVNYQNHVDNSGTYATTFL